MNKLTFLLVDDDSDDREIFAEVLNKIDASIDCHLAEDAEMAYDILQQVTPSLIFLDINMPRKNGWQLLSEFKSQDSLKEIPTVMYSTSSHPKDLQAAVGLGAADFIVKTSNIQELSRMIKEVSARLGFLPKDN